MLQTTVKKSLIHSSLSNGTPIRNIVINYSLKIELLVFNKVTRI